MSLDRMGIQEIKTGVLIIGSEAAGAKAAIEAQEDGADVLVVTKGLVGRSGNMVMAGPSVQAPLGHMDPRDNPDVFFKDVIRGGDYLNNQKLVERLVNLAVTEVPKLEKWGAKFRKAGDKFEQIQMPGSSYPRSLRSIGIHGGLQWRAAFKTQFKRLKTRILEDVFVTNLLLSDGQVAGAFGISLRDGQVMVFKSRVTLLATGGCPQIYRKTDSSIDATGDGMSMAYHAGAELMDMEFQQFFPYACYLPAFEMSEFPASFRYNLHAVLYNRLGEAFMERYLPSAGDWGLRSLTSRAIYTENMYGRGGPHGGAYLSVSHLPEDLIDDFIERTKPPWVRKLAEAGIDIHRHSIEVGPACHYSMGGIRINENCETTLPRLYAVGEVATGMDGAERIDGGAAIAWCLATGYIGGKEAARAAGQQDWLDVDLERVGIERQRVTALRERREGIRGFEVKDKIKDLMYRYCALVRDEKGMEEALRLIREIKKDDIPRLSVPDRSGVFNKGLVEALEAASMADCSEMVARAALMRKESRKSHLRTDFPERDNRNWLKNIVIRKEDKGMGLTTTPPVITKMRPPENEGVEA